MMVLTQENNGELPVKNLNASTKHINVPLDEDPAQGKEGKGSA
jgi:hypothetical protein